MTARVTTLKGPEAGSYYVEALGTYYLDGDEPPGRWRGAGAEALGLTGTLDEDDFLALMAGLDPTTGDDIGSHHTDRTVRGFDVTCSAPKSLSVLFAVGDRDTRTEVLAAHDAAVDAVVDWIERHAHCRHRVDGEIWTVDAEGIAAALFRQHTSRELDPQIHTHIVIPNRVAAPDGRWLALDARTLKRDQRTLSAIYHAGLRAELTDRLGVRWHEPKDGIAEMADIDPDVLDAFSTRTRAVQTRLDRKIDRFVDSLGREPTPRERWRLEREAVIDSRRSKTSADAPSLHQEWADRLVALGTKPEALVGDITGRANVEEPDLFTNGRIGAQAIDALSEQQSTWRAAEITREVARALPTTTASTARKVLDWVEQLGQEVEYDLIVDLTPPVAGHVPVRRDGRPVTEAAVERILTTSEILAQEDEIVRRAQARVDEPGRDLVDLADSALSGVQHEVAAAVAGTRPLVLVVGPAGTGKTTALQPAVDRLRADGRVVFGVTPSATAADVLATDTGVDADTLDKLLIEYRLDRPPDHRFDLPAGATVLVDEAAMVSTPALLELFALADRQRWRLALVGDPMQFAAVGRSGMFGHLVATFGAIELDRVHRFADEWERDASLALRHGDSDVVAIYDEHGRIHGGTGSQMRRAVLNAWWEAEQAGERAAMMAPTNEAIVRLNLAAQFRRLDAGQLDRSGPTVVVGEYTLHEGDRIATRRNERQLRTDRGQMVKNRDRWTVDAIHADGSLDVTGRTGSVRLAPEYVAEHVELAYAETSHANQGRTVDRSFLYLDGTTDSRGIYVPLTRGRLTNEAFVVTEGEATAADIVAEAVARTWVDQPAITHRLDPDDGPEDDVPVMPGRGPVRSGPELRRLFERRHDLLDNLSRPRMDRAERAAAGTRLTELDRRRAEIRAAIAAARRVLAESKATLVQNQRPVDRLVHRTRTADAGRNFEAARRSLKTLRPEATEVSEERTRLQAEVRAAEQAEADRPQIDDERRSVEEELTADRAARLDQLDGSDLDLIIARLGPEPAAPTVGKLWREAAGAIAQHREAFALDDDTLLGAPPRDSDYDAYATSHRDAEASIEDLDRAIGRPLERQGLERPGLSL